MQLLRQEWNKHFLRPDDGSIDLDDLVRITSWGTTAITARKTSGTSVNVLTVRKAVDFCTVPSIPESSHEERTQTINFSDESFRVDSWWT